MQRLPWVQRTFHFDIPPGWLPNIIARLEGAAIRLEYYAQQVTEEVAAERVNGKWSIKEHTGHLADLEGLHTGRLKDFSERREVLRAADMANVATEKADHNQSTLPTLIAAFKEKRKEFIAILTTLDDDTQNFSSLHPRLKVMMKPVDIAFFTAEHDDHHIASIIDLIKVFRGRLV